MTRAAVFLFCLCLPALFMVLHWNMRLLNTYWLVCICTNWKKNQQGVRSSFAWTFFCKNLCAPASVGGIQSMDFDFLEFFSSQMQDNTKLTGNFFLSFIRLAIYVEKNCHKGVGSFNLWSIPLFVSPTHEFEAWKVLLCFSLFFCHVT